MTRIAFILLCHRDPQGIVEKAKLLAAQGDYVLVHFDGRASRRDFEEIREGLAGQETIRLAPQRIKCGWGEWSLVSATLTSLRAARTSFAHATHFYLVSGDCQPIQPLAAMRSALARNDIDHIEAVDFFTSDWIRTGMKDDRLTYRHLFNERSQKGLFYLSLRIQRNLGLSRKPPADLRIMIGSQWWCLRRATVDRLLEFLAQRPDVQKFFATTWIPDETFFQTLVSFLVPDAEITGRAPTFLMFTDYGMPVAFYNDHYDLLVRQDAFFARKISPGAQDLQKKLTALWTEDTQLHSVSDEGARLHGFLTGRGRFGRRFARRFWEEAQGTREIMIVACKKWHVAKRLLHFVGQEADLRTMEFVFNEQACAMPNLGGVETSLEKRNRHRRAVVSLLFQALSTNKLVLCVDLSAIDIMRDLAKGNIRVRVLEVECEYSDAYLEGHANRIGLVSERSSPDTVARVLPTLRNEIAFDHEQLAEADLGPISRVSERDRLDDTADTLARFFGIPVARMSERLQTTQLFQD